MANGERKEVPCWLELEVKKKEKKENPRRQDDNLNTIYFLQMNCNLFFTTYRLQSLGNP